MRRTSDGCQKHFQKHFLCAMKHIKTDWRSHLSVNTLTRLPFISLEGPDMEQFMSMSAVDRWLAEADRRSLEWTRAHKQMPLCSFSHCSILMSTFLQISQHRLSSQDTRDTRVYYQGHPYSLKCYYHKFCSLLPSSSHPILWLYTKYGETYIYTPFIYWSNMCLILHFAYLYHISITLHIHN